MLEILQKDKNLIIDDISYARRILAKTGYFSLISGYKSIFKNPTTGKFKDGTTFEDIYRLYLFDNELRSIFLKYILIAEHGIKSSLAYYFTEAYGEDQKEYLSMEHYMVTKSTQCDVRRMINILSYNITHRSDYTFITHYKNQHKNVPLWIMIQVLTLGQLSHMFDLLKANVPIKMCCSYHDVGRKDMHSFLSVMTKHRNVCAHGERFYNYVTKDSITDTLLHKKIEISREKGRYQKGKTDIFSEVIILKYLLDKEDFHNFYYELIRCFKKYRPNEKIMNIMGFPEKWMAIIRLKL